MFFIIAFLNVLFIVSLAWWLGRRVAGKQRALYWVALCVKCLAGLAVGVVYYYHYGLGDTIFFFDNAVRLADLLKDDPRLFISSLISGAQTIDQISREPRSYFFSIMVTLANLASGNNYWISSLWFSFFSFACTWYLVDRISQQVPGLHHAAIVSFLFVPSVVFWSAGIIKESVAFGSLCFLAGVLISVLTGRRLRWYEYVATVIALWFLLSLKYYWAAVFLPAAITTLVVHLLVAAYVRTTASLLVSWLLIFSFCCVLASFTHPNFYFETFLDVIRLNHQAFVAISRPENVIHFLRDIKGWDDVIINAPWALFSGLFRPLPFEPTSITGHVSSIENIVLLLLSIGRLARVNTSNGVERTLLFSLFIYTCLLCIFLALSTPNFGTLSRYRIGFLPFFVMTILHDNFLLKKMGLRDI
jgi:hypothetical protein